MIFWNYIKGLNGEDSNNLIYSYLVWSQEGLTDNSTADEKYRPELIISKNQKLNGSNDYLSLGKLLTEKGGIKIKKDDNDYWKINYDSKELKIIPYIKNKDGEIVENATWGGGFNYSTYTPFIKSRFISIMPQEIEDIITDGSTRMNNSLFSIHYNATGQYIKFMYNTINFSRDWLNLTSKNLNEIIGNKNTKADFSYCDIAIDKNSSFTAECQINATSFNATSDIRAKTNIKPLLMSATNYLSNLKLYSYNYKSDNSQSIGIIAQEVEQQPVKDLFNQEILNLANTPKDDKAFYTIKQDKLVYLCIKAIQEQNEEIKKLKREIEDLKLYSQK